MLKKLSLILIMGMFLVPTISFAHHNFQISETDKALAQIPEGSIVILNEKGEIIYVDTSTVKAPTATCSGSACNGKDPQSTGCGIGATTLDVITLYGYGTEYYEVGKLELRYSPTCKTKWSRITRYQTDPAYPYARPFLRQSSTDIQYKWFGTTTYQKWSYQVYAPSATWKACGSLALNGTTNLYEHQCTAKR